MLRKNILIFIKRNTLISAFFIISIVIITSYYLTLDLPELFGGAEQWFNLLFQLSVGYIINFMFYITQVYVPNNKRDSIARRNVSMRLKQIIKNMRNSLSSLAEIYLDGHTGTDYTAEELSSLLQLRFSDKVKVLNANRTTRENMVYFSVREWLGECIRKTEDEIDKLYKYYPTDISVELMKVLEDILNSTYHSMMKTLLVVPNDVDFSQCNNNFFAEYYKLICELEKIDAYVNEQAYESIPESIGSMVSEAVFTSASNVERFFHMLPENAYVETAYSIGEKTTAVLEQHNVREIVQADDSSYEALVDKISYKDAFKD